MIIENGSEVAITALRESVLEIIEEGITLVLPSALMQCSVKFDSAKRIFTVKGTEYDVAKGRIFVIGGGKAACTMAKTLENILSPENITDGIVTCKTKEFETLKIKTVMAGHPKPDERGFQGVEQMLSLKRRYAINSNDIIICLISGGGSALMPCPVDEVSLPDKRKLTELLLSNGVTIHEINTVRKHLSKTKGGGLGLYFAPATVITLIISDVIGDDLEIIASGQTCPDTSTFLNALDVIKKYHLILETPKSIVDYLEKGCRKEVEETPKYLENCHNYIIGDNAVALEAMAEKAEEKGWEPCIVTATQQGDTTAVAKLRASEIINNYYTGCDCLLLGGETTPKLPANHGKGGRNQHYAAVTMLEMTNYPGEWTVASVGTDGSDYLPDIAGAIVDTYSIADAKAKNIDVQTYLDNFDSYNLLKHIGHSLIKTGGTGTNVGDIIIYALPRVKSSND